MLLAALAVIAMLSWRTRSQAPGATPAPQKIAAAPANAIPEHSIAVLPFANLSERKDEEYFSDGLAEDLLNLLSKVPGLQVAARTSAFTFKGRTVDVPTMGRQLKVASVLEGTVRKVGNHLRVTAQLERASDGYQIWSETYDRELGDVFRMQDEIANTVVKALKVSLLWGAAPRSLSTQNSEAYLVFLQGRAKMATQRLADTKAAITDFERTLKLDPNYAPAYVELAAAKLRLAEFENTDKRQTSFDAAREESKLLIERALALDPSNAQAYMERGYLRAFSDLKGAEQDYRRGIELDPNSARGYEGLATVVYQDPRRRDEALALLTEARQLDPLDPKYDVLRAQILLYARGNAREADALLTEVVAHHPLYQPAVVKLALAKLARGHLAEAVIHGEQALKLDPLSDWARRQLISNYVFVGDAGTARLVADEAPHALPIQQITLLLHDGEWHRAAEVSYAALVDGTALEMDLPAISLALRRGFRATHDFHRARAALERLCRVTWDPKGVPTGPTLQYAGAACVALGDILIASGERGRGERLLRASLAGMDSVAQDRPSGELWYLSDRAFALALLGDRKATLGALRKVVAAGVAVAWEGWSLGGPGMDPAFDSFRDDAEYQALVRQMKAQVARERQLLDRLRAEGRVPDRGAKKNPAVRP
jgi:TolB-like protein/Tfp pilus assembly protein PilF